MTTTTAKDVREAFAALVNASRAIGFSHTVTVYENDRREDVTLTADDLRLQEGSPTYGQAFRLYLLGPYGAHYTPGELPEYLGWTRAEAERTLRGLTAGINTARTALGARS
jgi:hypothetical protein